MPNEASTHRDTGISNVYANLSTPVPTSTWSPAAICSTMSTMSPMMAGERMLSTVVNTTSTSTTFSSQYPSTYPKSLRNVVHCTRCFGRSPKGTIPPLNCRSDR